MARRTGLGVVLHLSPQSVRGIAWYTLNKGTCEDTTVCHGITTKQGLRYGTRSLKPTYPQEEQNTHQATCGMTRVCTLDVGVASTYISLLSALLGKNYDHENEYASLGHETAT